MGDLLCHLGPCDVQVCAAAEGKVGVHGPTTTSICVLVHGLYKQSKFYLCV